MSCRAPAGPTQTRTVHAGRFWDGRSDALQHDVDIVIDGHRIKSVEPHRAAHAGTVIDASNETVIPGLIEIHTHLSQDFGEALGRAFLSWGITTVRNPAANTFETMEFREAFESGARVGPRLDHDGRTVRRHAHLLSGRHVARRHRPGAARARSTRRTSATTSSRPTCGCPI